EELKLGLPRILEYAGIFDYSGLEYEFLTTVVYKGVLPKLRDSNSERTEILPRLRHGTGYCISVGCEPSYAARVLQACKVRPGDHVPSSETYCRRRVVVFPRRNSVPCWTPAISSGRHSNRRSFRSFPRPHSGGLRPLPGAVGENKAAARGTD